MSEARVKQVLFDTQEFVQTMRECGFSESQANGMSRGINRILGEGVATSQDIRELNTKIDNLSNTLTLRLGGAMAVMLTLVVAILKWY